MTYLPVGFFPKMEVVLAERARNRIFFDGPNAAYHKDKAEFNKGASNGSFVLMGVSGVTSLTCRVAASLVSSRATALGNGALACAVITVAFLAAAILFRSFWTREVIFHDIEERAVHYQERVQVLVANDHNPDIVRLASSESMQRGLLNYVTYRETALDYTKMAQIHLQCLEREDVQNYMRRSNLAKSSAEEMQLLLKRAAS